MITAKRLGYKWRLFFPMVVLLWAIFAILIAYQYKREVDFRRETASKTLDIISYRLIDAYEHNTDMRQFMNFVGNYFDNSMFDEASVCVYNSQTGALEYSAGLPVLQDFSESVQRPEFADAVEGGSGTDLKRVGESMFYYTARRSNDGKIYVHTAMPYTVTISDAIAAESNFWIIVIILAIAVTAFAYISTSYLTRNVTLLRNFADKAANGHVDMDLSRFPHDELGDISRQIIKLYTDKDAANTRSEREHRIALHAVEEKARIKKQLTNNINHELKTPIGVIKGYLDTITSNPDMDDETRARFLNRAQENVERLCSLLNDVSAMTRLEDGAGSIPVSDVDFHDLVFTIESDLTQSGIAGDMTFNYDIPLDCKVKGNNSLLTGMISNLIKNAAQHSHGTEMGIRLIVESERHYTFGFYDNGTGVDAEHLPHLFERFYRIDTGRSRKVGGTGLGLPIVKNTVEALGGSISVHNVNPHGLEFVFTLEKWQDKQTVETD